MSESRFPDLLETLVVEVIERVGGHESGAQKAGVFARSLWQDFEEMVEWLKQSVAF